MDGIYIIDFLSGWWLGEATHRPNYFLILFGNTCTNKLGYNTAQPEISLEDDPPYLSPAQPQALALNYIKSQRSPEVGPASRALSASKSKGLFSWLYAVTRTASRCPTGRPRRA